MGLCIAGMIASMAHRGNPRGYVPDIHPLPSYFLFPLLSPSGPRPAAFLVRGFRRGKKILDMQPAPMPRPVCRHYVYICTYLNVGKLKLLFRDVFGWFNKTRLDACWVRLITDRDGELILLCYVRV